MKSKTAKPNIGTFAAGIKEKVPQTKLFTELFVWSE